jgi:hypothetical protein
MKRVVIAFAVLVLIAIGSFALAAATVGNADAQSRAEKLHVLVSRTASITGLRGVDTTIARCPPGYFAFSGSYITTGGSDVEIVTASPTGGKTGFAVTAIVGPLAQKATIQVRATCLERDQAYVTDVG